ncbi:MAG: lipB [Rickettsiaceae bacterium]|jgi:lipoyl(octanoyl) transferase|nr:lipB [Rickettsiaceae bacterium]
MEWKTSPGLISYEEAVAQMEARVAGIIAGTEDEMVWLVEHPPLYTAGTSAKAADLLDSTRFPVYSTGRGGEYTYHGPGQRVAYVMLNLKQRNAEDLKLYVSNLEQWIINTLAVLGIKGERHKGRVGIWVDDGYGNEKKVAAIGIRVRKWVTYHGIALNINPDLKHFSGIVPCGIKEYGVTSLAGLGCPANMACLDAILQQEFGKIFGS